MKQKITLLLFLLTSMTAFCDTLDFWHVYINNKLVAQFNETTKDLSVLIKKTEINENDTLTVRYGSDHPCADCIYGLIVLAEIKRKSPEATTKEHFGKLSIPIKAFLEIQKSNELSKFYFNYYEKTNKGIETRSRKLFVLTISEN